MTWIYQQSTGHLTKNDVLIAVGYSGAKPDGENNPEMQNVVGIGPIPQGQYIIGPAYNDIGGLGPCVMHLDPLADTNTFGRSLFRMHGDNSTNNASHGCIIMGKNTRNQIASSEDRDLMVIS